MKQSRQPKPTFSELFDALVTLCRSEKAAPYFQALLSDASTGYNECLSSLSQIIARTDNAVIKMLAVQAMRAR